MHVERQRLRRLPLVVHRVRDVSVPPATSCAASAAALSVPLVVVNCISNKQQAKMPRPDKCAVVSQTDSKQLAEPASSCLLKADVAAIARSEGVPPRIPSLRKRFGTDDETAWLRQLKDRELATEIARTRFRPQMPEEWKANPRAWLNNLDIHNVLSQYEANLATSQRAFKFLGVFPSDFSTVIGGKCVSPVMCQVRVKDEVAAGVRGIAMVFNLDVHTGPGTHWTACCIGLDPSRPERFGIYYYDSVGKRMPKGMREFFERIEAEAAQVFKASSRAVKKPFAIHENIRQKQRKQTECGIYATSFIIICFLTDIPFDNICDSVMKDDDSMQRLRSTLFR